MSKGKLGLVTGVCALALAPAAMALTITGTDGDDRILGSRGDDVILALEGDDKVRSFGGADDVGAGKGDDKVAAGNGRDFVRGAGGDDRVRGGDGADVLRSGLGADVAAGQDGNDRMFASAKLDVETEGVDALNGGRDNDRLHARDNEPDLITCGRGRRDRATLDLVDVITDATAENPDGSCETVDRAESVPPVEPTR